VKLDSVADVSKYGQIRRSYPAGAGDKNIRPGPDIKIWPDFGRDRGQIRYPVQPYSVMN